MNPLLNIKEIFFIGCILSCCFLTNLAVEVTSENVEEYFKFEFGKANPRLNWIRSTSKQITKISVDAFNNTSNCGRFEISHCKELSTIPEYLFQERRVFQNVNMVIFSTTGITNFPALLFLDLQLLRTVMIYNSKIETLHEEFFQSNTKMEFLDISGNKLLKRLPPGLLKNNRILQKIKIWGNNLLEHLPPQLFQNLLLLDGIIFQLQENGLKFIEYETFANIDFLKVKQLDLSNNYLVCLPDYFLNATIIPEQIRSKINLTGNCFDEASQLCQKYECQNRVANECENARSSTNVRSCQKGFESPQKHFTNKDDVCNDNDSDFTNDFLNDEEADQAEFENDESIEGEDDENEFETDDANGCGINGCYQDDNEDDSGVNTEQENNEVETDANNGAEQENNGVETNANKNDAEGN